MIQIEKIKNSIASYSSLSSLEEKVASVIEMSFDFQILVEQNCKDENMDKLKEDVLNYIESCLYLVAARWSEGKYNSQLLKAKERVKAM